ncbi:MAG: alpha/beta fold hydrolase [Anaerolineae bacterium]
MTAFITLLAAARAPPRRKIRRSRPSRQPSKTVEATVETTPEATVEATGEGTPEATAEATLPPGAMTSFPGPGTYTVRQQNPDGDRFYNVYIPFGYSDLGDPVALVIVMHGAGGSGAGTESFTGFDLLADREHFVVVYPDGVNNGWNDDRVGNPGISAVDDVRFLDRIVDFMTHSLNIDPLRVYAAGYSMGGMMSYRVGCELPQHFAAVASVASTMPIYLIDNCTDTPPVPVLVFEGTDDPVVPWMGIPGGYLSAAQTIGFWRDHNACTGSLSVEILPDIVADDYTVVMRQQVSECAADIVLYGVYFGGHTWPGHPIDTQIRLGQTSRDIDATGLIWEFFSSHVNTTPSESD